MAIKVSIGKLDVPLAFTLLVRQHVRGNTIEVLQVEPEHLDEQRKMPFHHRDLFDRLMFAQAIAEEIPIVSRDSTFEEYSAQLIWEAE